VVKKQMAKNNIRFVRYSFCQKGGLFDQMPLRKGFGQVPRKAGLEINKYGAYQKSTISYYHIVKYLKGKKTIISIIPVELRMASKLTDTGAIKDYCANELGIDNAQVLLNGRKLKVNSLLEIDGFRVSISCRSNDSIWFKCGMQLVLPQKYESYVKRIISFCDKVNEAAKIKAAAPTVTVYDKLNTDDNLALYDILLDKVKNTAFRVLMDTPLKVLEENRTHFISLSPEEQAVALSHIVELFSCTTSSGKDLTLINGSKSSGILKMSMALNSKRFKVIRIIDQSPTGLIECRSENLLDL
ncbi:MAG: Cas9 endonuclease PAM-interacting domain-containing protein, partial [Oscillospiraceae bacterium]